MANTSLGGIIGTSAVLNDRNPQKHLNPFATVLQKQQRDAAAKKQQAKENDLGDILQDMVVIDKSLKKPYAQDMAKVMEGLVVKANEYQNDGKGNAKNRLYKDYVTEFLPRIQSLKAGNAEALRYEDLIQNGKIKGYDSIIDKINTADSTADLDVEVKRLGDPHVISDNLGNFSFIGIEPYDFSKFNKLESNDYLEAKIGTPREIGYGLAEVTKTSQLSPQVIEQRRQMLLNDDRYIKNIFHDAPVEVRSDRDKFNQYVNEDVNRRLSGLQRELVDKYTVNLPSDSKSSTSFNFNTGGTGSNDRFTVTEITPGVVQDATITEVPKRSAGGEPKDEVVAQLRVNKGYAIKDLTAPENSPQFWSSSTAFDVNTGKLIEGFKKKGSLVAVNEESQLEDAKGNVIHKFKNPMAVIKVEEGTGDEKQTKVYTIPYNSVKGEIKGYTADKKGQNGWELPRGADTKQASNKTVPLSTIRGLVGTKGYEGYDEKELVDYYKSQGYDIK